MDDQPTTQELRIDQIRREREESTRADEADLPEEEHAARRRADKAAYLRRKLDEQEEADEQRP
jgi:hypothetical protein